MIAAIPDHKTEKCGEWLGWQRVAFKVKRFLCYVRLCYDRMTCQLWKKNTRLQRPICMFETVNNNQYWLGSLDWSPATRWFVYLSVF